MFSGESRFIVTENDFEYEANLGVYDSQIEAEKAIKAAVKNAGKEIRSVSGDALSKTYVDSGGVGYVITKWRTNRGIQEEIEL